MGADAQEPVDGTEVDATVSDPQGQESQQPPEGGNPAWATLREELDPISFSRIEPHLKSWDTGVNQRFEKLNEEFGWAREIAKQGVTPEYVNTSLQLAEMINTNPLGAYQQIQEYLRSTGQLTEEESQQVAAQAVQQGQQNQPEAQPGEPGYVDPQVAELQQRLAYFEQQQSQTQAYIEQQAQEQLDRQADAEIENEIQQLSAAHPEYSQQDIGEIVQRALIMGQKTGQVPTLAEAEADYAALRNRLLTAPRAGDSAPRLLPTGGGLANPSAAPQQTLGGLSNQETQDLIAGLISQNQG